MQNRVCSPLQHPAMQHDATSTDQKAVNNLYVMFVPRRKAVSLLLLAQ